MATSEPKVAFKAIQIKSDEGWHVLVTLPNGQQPYLGGFKTEADAINWIARESKAWLKGYESGRFV
jgi:hypothetical protein